MKTKLAEKVQHFSQYISQHAQQLPLQDFLDVVSRRKTENDWLDLSTGVPLFDVPEKVKEAAMQAVREGKNRYTEFSGMMELRKAICKKLKEKNNILAEPEQVMVTAAASGGLALAVMTLLNPGDEVIIFDPYFLTYKAVVRQAGGVPVMVKTKSDFSLDLAALEKKITAKTKALLLNTPNNPTGKVYGLEELQLLAEIARAQDIFIIADEVYEDFCYDQKHISVGSFYEKTITVNSFSKSWAMTGWRIGYLVGPKEIMPAMLKLQLLYYVCAPTPFQYAALTALEEGPGDFLAEYRRKRDAVYEGLREHYDIIKPEGAFYAFVKYPYEPEKFLDLCQEKKLLVVPGKIFSERDTHFRISFAQKDEMLKKAVKVMREIFPLLSFKTPLLLFFFFLNFSGNFQCLTDNAASLAILKELLPVHGERAVLHFGKLA